MPIPDYQTLMLPLLKLLADELPHKTKDAIESLAINLNIKDTDRQKLLSGGQPIFNNRVGWARTYLKKAGLISSPTRGILEISERGKAVLSNGPVTIDNSFLKQFPEFLKFQNYKSEDVKSLPVKPTNETDDKTPEERIDIAYQMIRQSLAQEVLDTVRNLSPAFFERLVVELLVKMGYGGSIKDAGQAVGKTGDEGIDGTIKEDKLGLDIIYIQAKRWQEGNVVGRPELHKFVGALAGQGAKKGIFITTSSFTKEALNYSPKNEIKIVLINGDELAQLMIDYNLGVSPQRHYEIKRIDSDYFEEG
ncbi:restriction system protein [Pedobacter westerhofensis]|uniref:Restriction system protein n=1 Tax=Pedobacter westerhofensis TaxID=425512 RepID=A0A521FUP6_9SPHI|nr:restriction endonuclease [Pedobacter westerhofensis]SMO99856.1 restriction system protein [Pedobacter westerhofensis]